MESTSKNTSDQAPPEGIFDPTNQDGNQNSSAESQAAKPGRGIYIPPPPDSRPCVVCKNVHLSCDRMRPCGRCIRLKRESECCDPPSSRRGRKTRGGEPGDDKISDDQTNTTPVRVKSEKKQKTRAQALVSAAVDLLPNNLSGMDDPFQIALREGFIRLYWNHYHILGCSQEYAAMMGFKQEELFGMPWVVLHPPELNEYYIRGMDSFLTSVPEYVTELDNGTDLVLITRTGRRFQVLIEYKMFLRNRAPLMGWSIVRAILSDNLPPNYLPPASNGGIPEMWNRLPALRLNQNTHSVASTQPHTLHLLQQPQHQSQSQLQPQHQQHQHQHHPQHQHQQQLHQVRFPAGGEMMANASAPAHLPPPIPSTHPGSRSSNINVNLNISSYTTSYPAAAASTSSSTSSNYVNPRHDPTTTPSSTPANSAAYPW